VALTVWRHIWIGPETENVRCQIEVEILGDPRTSREYGSIARRIYHDGLVPLVQKNGMLAEFVDSTREKALARAKIYLDRRFGFGTVSKPEDTTQNMRVFPSERVPEKVVIAGYRRFGCSICKIGEPNEETFSQWIDHATREHGYQVVSDTRERAPRLRNVERLFRVVRMARPSAADVPSRRGATTDTLLPRMMPRKVKTP
jgi:hypothetical protein